MLAAHWDEIEPIVHDLGHLGGSWRPLGAAAGTRGVGVHRVDLHAGTWPTPLHREKRIAPAGEQSGLTWVRLHAGGEGAPPHVHSFEEEVCVILEGAGEVELWPGPQLARTGRGLERVPVRAGHVAAFPPGGGPGHGLRAGEEGLTYLAYGTRVAGDVCLYPRSNRVSFRGLGLIARLEALEYADGEPGSSG